MSMFAKTSIQSFNYDVIDVFMFPNSKIQEIYNQYIIKKCLLLQNLTDTDSTSLTFLFTCFHNCPLTERESRNLIFKIMLKSKLRERLDLSDDFYAQFDAQNKKVKKQVGLYEVECISNPNIITVAINPKEYFEQHQDYSINKKAKGIRHDTEGMTLEAYIDRLSSKDEQLYDKKILQKRFRIRHNAMEMVSIEKNRFASLNDKLFYFMGGIVSLPFGHKFLEPARNLKSQFRSEITTKFIDQLYEFIDSEQSALSRCERLRIFQTILN